jgi:rRNA maturation protein Nop10
MLPSSSAAPGRKAKSSPSRREPEIIDVRSGVPIKPSRRTMTTPAKYQPMDRCGVAGGGERGRADRQPAADRQRGADADTATKASTMKDHCPDCGAPVGEKHKDGCDVERCPHCGGGVRVRRVRPERPRAVNRGTGAGRARRTPNGWGSSLVAIARCPISTACLRNAAGTPISNDGSTTHRQRVGGERTDELVAACEDDDQRRAIIR